MFEKIKEELKNQGLSENYAKYVLLNVEQESDIEGAVGQLKTKMDDIESKKTNPQDFMKEVAGQVGLQEILNDSFQREGDRRASEAVNTYKKNNQNNSKTQDPNKQQDPNDQTQNQGGGGENDKLLKRIDQLEKKLNEKSKTDEKMTKTDEAKKLFKGKGLSEDLAGFIDVDDEESSVEDQVSIIEQQFNDHAQKVIDQKVENEEYVPARSKGKPAKAKLEKAAEKIKEQYSQQT